MDYPFAVIQRILRSKNIPADNTESTVIYTQLLLEKAVGFESEEISQHTQGIELSPGQLHRIRLNLLEVIRDSSHSEQMRCDAAFLLGKFFEESLRASLRPVLEEALDAKLHKLVYQTIIALENCGDRILSGGGGNIDETSKNMLDARWYLERGPLPPG